MAARALRAGGRQVSPGTVEWDLSGNCQMGYTREVTARRSPEHRRYRIDKWIVGGRWMQPTRYTVLLVTRCRRCVNCRRVRSNLWRHRAQAETRMAHRTWMGTLTLRPAEYYKALTRARQKEQEQGIDFETLPETERFALIHAQIGPELTRYMKRVRRDRPLRFILVCEAHKSGVPHYHALVHEPYPDMPVNWETLSKQWFLGFSKWKLVDDANLGGSYVSKYLTKDALARVRASVEYGETAYALTSVSEV